EGPVEIDRRPAKVMRMMRQDRLRVEAEVEVEGVSVVEARETDVGRRRQRLLHVAGTKKHIDVVHWPVVGTAVVPLGQDAAVASDPREPARTERIRVRAGKRGDLSLTAHRVVTLLP